MESEEVLKAVFPFLDGTDLASCMLVCKQWRNITRDDYLWKCLCAKRWPSVCKNPPPTFNFYKVYSTFYKRENRPKLLPPRLSFEDLDFYIDIWAENQLMFSLVVPGPDFKDGIKEPPVGVSDMLRFHLSGPEYKMTFPVEPRFKVPMTQQASVSVLVSRRDSRQMACITNKAVFGYIDRTAHRALAFDYLDISPAYPFVPRIRAWISLLLVDIKDSDSWSGDEGGGGLIDVFGLEMDFCDAANTEREVLWLLDMLDWK